MMKVALVAALGVGPIGAIPGAGMADAAAVGGIWTTLFVSMTGKAGKSLSQSTVKSFVTAVVAGAGTYYIGCKLASWAFFLIPVFGQLGAVAISCLANALFTYRFGYAVQTMIDHNTIDSGNVGEMADIALKKICGFPSVGEMKEIISFFPSIDEIKRIILKK